MIIVFRGVREQIAKGLVQSGARLDSDVDRGFLESLAIWKIKDVCGWLGEVLMHGRARRDPWGD